MSTIANPEGAVAKIAACTEQLNAAIAEGDIESISKIGTNMRDLFELVVDVEDYDTMELIRNAVKALAHPIEQPPRDTSYNGWSNYETWVLKLWMDNEQGDLEHWLDEAKSAESKVTLADQMKDEYEEAMPETTGVWSDLLTAALGEVDWFEIAEHLLEEVGENTRYEIEKIIEAGGSTSSDSCLLEDIVAGVEDLLPEKLFDEFQEADEEDEQPEIFNEICDYLNEIAPEGVTFSTQDGDGACYGFWKDEAEE